MSEKKPSEIIISYLENIQNTFYAVISHLTNGFPPVELNSEESTKVYDLLTDIELTCIQAKDFSPYCYKPSADNTIYRNKS